MAFIGNTNTTQAFTPAVDFFSGNGSTTAFTLSRPVASVAQVQVTIDNVAQNPSSAFTVSANTLTFTSAPLSGTNNIYVYYTSPITQVIAPGQGTVNIAAFNATGTPSSSTYLRGDNTWSTVSGGVTSATAGTGISVSASTGAVTFTNTGVTALTTSSGLSTNTNATGAVSVTNTGVTSVVAGTGISVSGATGAVTVSVSGGGGVTSLNGQTGAVVTTDINAIGSIIQAAANTTSNQVVGSTISGGSLYYATSITQADGPPTFRLYSEGPSGNNSTVVNQSPFLPFYFKKTNGNTGYATPAGCSTLSGTWRFLSPIRSRFTTFNGCDNNTDSNTFIAYLVRIS